MKHSNDCSKFAIALLLSACLLAGCGGTRVLKEPQPLQTTKPLATESDERVTVILDWVIVRDGPGTWARNADWDEYLLRVSNRSALPIRINELVVIDSLNTRIASEPGRKELVEGSKKTARRYKKTGIKVKAGHGSGTMLVTGAAVTVVGVGAAYGAASAALASGATSAGGAGTALGGLVLLGPALAVGGILRGVNNHAVNEEILLRQTELPLEVAAGEEVQLTVFFPLVPSPCALELSYAEESGEHTVAVDTSMAMNGLHLDATAKQ